MNFQENLNIIANSDAFRKWNHPEAYLVSCFSLDDKWQYDFYSKKTKKISSFHIENNNVSILEKDSEVFQKNKEDLEELDLSKIKTKLDQVVKIIEKIKKEKIPYENVTKKIIILQKIKTPLWNISYITSAFNVLNVKINAINSKIIEQKLESVISFRK